MVLQNCNVMAEVLGVNSPWAVTDVRVTAGSARLVSIQIEQLEAPGRFWSARKSAPVQQKLRWGHASMGGVRCEVVLALRDGQRLPDADWAGEVDSPFTRTLSRRALDLLLEGVGMDQLCRLRLVPCGVVWMVRGRLELGPPRARGPAAPAATAEPAVVAPSTAPVQDAGAARLPPQDSPVWLMLLSGRLALDVRTLGLRLLLAKLQRESRMHHDADLYAQAAQSLHRFFAKNLSLLAHEVSQLDRAALQLQLQPQPRDAAPAPTADELPDVSDPMWLALLHGKRDLDVRTLSLKLLLTKLRTQARAIRDDEVMMLKLVELHRFFTRHRSVLRHEIAQLQRWSVH